MKKSLLLMFLLLLSCKDKSLSPDFVNDVYFNEPQPINDSELSKIPIGFRGLYMNSDSICYNVLKDKILKENYFRFKIHKSQLDSIKKEFTLSNGLYINKINNDVFETKVIKDSIEFFNKQIDTLFIFSNLQKAKKVSNYLFLNFKDSIYWKTTILNFEKNTLNLYYIYADEHIKKFDSLTKIKSKIIDSTTFVLSPTRREFKKFLALHKKEFNDQFKKISK